MKWLDYTSFSCSDVRLESIMKSSYKEVLSNGGVKAGCCVIIPERSFYQHLKMEFLLLG